ncbi:MAG: flagellin [Romboutsia sp.]|nr:flagellin [Romboutsia sp.]
MRIYNNISAIKASSSLAKVNKAKTSNLEKLSSGLRINKASDDAAGLAISEKMRGQLSGMKQAVRNASDGQAALQTAEGAMNEINTIIQRMRELSVQSLNETYNQDERDKIIVELKEINAEISRIAGATKFNGKQILNGNNPNGQGGDFTLKLQVGANNDASEQLDISIVNINTISKAIADGITDVEDAKGVDTDVTDALGDFLDIVDDQLEEINKNRSIVGAQINRLEYTINNLNTSIENLTDAESRIRDVDMAAEMLEFTRHNILAQTGAQMVATANKMPEGVLQLLQ